MQYQITHLTSYDYSDPVGLCHNQLRMLPRNMMNANLHSTCHSAEVLISPAPTFRFEHTDYFGNRVLTFSIERAHRRLSVTASSRVEISIPEIDFGSDTRSWEDHLANLKAGTDENWLEIEEFTHPSPRIQPSAIFQNYAQHVFTPNRPLLECAIALTQKIHDDFRYDPEATQVDTTIEQVFETRAGVCQDFAQVQIACLRSLGLPAKYVSGYLRTNPPPGQSKKIGADESHAWVSLYAGHEMGWVDLDPTNCKPVDCDYIPTAIGRDYSEASPMRGVAIGGGEATLTVSVNVEPVSDSKTLSPRNSS